MTTIVPGPWIPALDHRTVPELHRTVAEKEAEILFLLKVARAAQFLKSELEGIAMGKVLPAENRRAAERALRYVEREFPQLAEMGAVGL